MATLLVGCPVGCPAGKPQIIFAGPEEQIAVQRAGPCSFKVATPPLKHPFPSSEAGFYGVEIDGYTAWLEWVTYDEQNAIFSVREPWCKHHAHSFSLYFQHLERTANQ